MNIEEALSRFLVQLEADGRSGHTIGQYRRHVRALARWLAAERLPLDVAAVTHEDIAAFVASPAARCRPDGTPKTGTSVNAMRGSLRGFFSYLHEAGYVAANPTRLLRRAICSPPPPRALTDDEQRRLLEVLDGGESYEARRDAALVRTMLGTGLRLSSALALRVEDLDLVAREVTIRSSKGSRPDRLPISREVTRVLSDWIEDRTDGVLFGSRSGWSLCARHVQRRFRKAVEAAGITRAASPHALRHSFATRLYARTGDLGLVQAALHHRSIASTLVYARTSVDRLRAAIG
jgi:site-specific recombinase XerC